MGEQFGVKTAQAANTTFPCPVFTSPGGTCIDTSEDNGITENGEGGSGTTSGGGSTGNTTDKNGTATDVAASGTCTDIENGNAVTAADLEKLFNKTPMMRLLKGKQQEIYAAAQKFKINPLYSIAVAKKESAVGTAYDGAHHKWFRWKNMMGLGSTSYSDWYLGITSSSPKGHMALIRNSYLSGTYRSQVAKFTKANGGNVMSGIEHVYTPHGDASNNPDANVKQMSSWIKSWCKLLGK